MPLLDDLRWRYATKQFDANKDIPAEKLEQLLDAIVLAPSSYGLQPWKVLVVTDDGLRTELRAVAFGQPQITDSSHLLVFCHRLDMAEADVDHLIRHIAEERGVTTEALQGYRDVMVGDVVTGFKHTYIAEWAKDQAYLTLGFALAAAATMRIDSCPMEGFDISKFEDILQTRADGYGVSALMAIGYRSPDDKYADLPKVRFRKDELIIRR